MKSNETNFTLYHLEECPFCKVVRKKLGELKLTTLLVPVEHSGLDRKELIRISGQQSVPLLTDGEKIIEGSAKILSYLDENYGEGTAKPLTPNDYGFRKKIKGSFETIKQKTIDALQKEGFGVMTEIDVSTTLKKKINVDIPKHVILGACNPKLAHQGLEAESDLGLLLPCNVVIKEASKDEYWVTAVNPVKLLSIVGRDDMFPIAKEVKNRFINVIASL
jgi:uncharacterized protein (DUF302 family)/glutaredoxin